MKKIKDVLFIFVLVLCLVGARLLGDIISTSISPATTLERVMIALLVGAIVYVVIIISGVSFDKIYQKLKRTH